MATSGGRVACVVFPLLRLSTSLRWLRRDCYECRLKMLSTNSPAVVAGGSKTRVFDFASFTALPTLTAWEWRLLFIMIPSVLQCGDGILSEEWTLVSCAGAAACDGWVVVRFAPLGCTDLLRCIVRCWLQSVQHMVHHLLETERIW